jgi:hypothetical protein
MKLSFRHNVRKSLMSTASPPLEREFKSSFLKEMSSRGFIHQCTDFEALDSKLSSEVVVAYLGFDATAESTYYFIEFSHIYFLL